MNVYDASSQLIFYSIFILQFQFVWSVVTPLLRAESRYTTKASGVQSAMTSGPLMTPMLSAVSLATLQHPRLGRMLTLVKDQDQFSWTMLDVLESKNT